MNLGLARNRSFLSLTGAQFLGHLNDNLFKMVVSLIALDVARTQAGFYVSLTSALLVLPYLIFSGYAGHLADIASKRSVMSICKVAEIVIMLAGLFMLGGLGSLEGLLVILFFMAAHETFSSALRNTGRFRKSWPPETSLPQTAFWKQAAMRPSSSGPPAAGF